MGDSGLMNLLPEYAKRIEKKNYENPVLIGVSLVVFTGKWQSILILEK
jgi:hypothetical protein